MEAKGRMVEHPVFPSPCIDIRGPTCSKVIPQAAARLLQSQTPRRRKEAFCCELCSRHMQWPQSHGCKPCAIPPCPSQVHPEPALNPRNNYVPRKDPVARDPRKYHVTPHMTLHVTRHMIHLQVTCHKT